MKPAASFILLLALMFFSCEVKVNTPSSKESKTEKTNAKIRNGIQLKANGLNVEQAFLTYEDGALVSNENKIDVNQKVVLRLIMDGWKEENGRVMIGATEKLTTSKGQTILDTDDLFVSYPEGVDAKDAKYITLSAVITRLDELYDYFLVEFRVWDKKGGGEVTGSYKLYLK
jgi:hypothetical protein